ncbi:Postreplication repair protein uvsH/nuvA [Moelleriella libera RCEF 2490]|uniref:Postreplication repair protein uvsH/nuvA n=1 Tax=Moelleriella libera RCEF 2490 TaxID=1081109 RepID=A0A166VGG6_9HYPO|nr:Postreplication repair protein uvsH/nuvA [Moelleriella libera RCEF 2490]
MSSSPEAKRLRTSARLSNQHKKGRNRDSHESGGAIIVAASEGVDRSEDEADPASGSVMGKSGSAQIVLEESDPSLMPADGLVPCPSCLKRMKEWQVFQHLEACPGPSSPNIAALPSFLNNQRAQGQELRQRTKIERLPAMNYSILKEQALRRKLAEIGISSTGSRTLLEKRHREWLNIWNANCDAAQPRNRAQLLQDLDMWEKSQGQRPGRGGTSNAIVITDKNFDAGAWAAKHDSSFKDLIRNARSKATVPSVIDQGLGPGSEQSAPDPLPGGALISGLGTDHPDQKTPADGESPGAPTVEST